MDQSVLLTVFTPAYNRAKTLARTYESLCSQTDKRFCWLIVDDGSTDNTKEIVSEWICKENGFEIRYIFKENQGMHTAHNVAYANIETELNVCIDSDDYMPEHAVEIILNYWEKNKRSDVAGVIALDADLKGQIIGSELPCRVGLASTTELYEKYHAKGDKKFIYRTDVINDVPEYPVFQGEKLVPLGYKYMLVAKKYKMLLLNEVVCVVDYQPDGSSNTILKQYLQSPRGFAAQCQITMECSSKLYRRFRSAVHYVAESRIAGESRIIESCPTKWLVALSYPLGCVAEGVIRFRNRKNESK